MAFTRFHDDPCRIQKYLDETTYVGNYEINVPGNGDKPLFFNDPHLRMQKWGANLSQNKTELESDLKGITRKLNSDSIEQNNYLDYNNNNNLYNPNIYPLQNNEITHQPRATNPAWELRDQENMNYGEPTFFNPQQNVFQPFRMNVDTRILEKDHYNPAKMHRCI